MEVTKIPFSNETNYKLYIKLFDQHFGIPIFNDLNKFISHDEVEINVSKIVYFFTTDNNYLKPIFKNEEIEFSIVLNDKWDKPIAKCQTNCLSFYDNDRSPKTTATVKNTLNFFSNSMKHFKCQVYIGLHNDREIPADNLPLYNYKLSGSLYLTDYDYYSYHPLPDDWYELFLPNNMQLGEPEDHNHDLIRQIINNLEENKKDGNQKTNKDELYDPYYTLVQIQEKKNLISKIKSIPAIYDKNYADKKKLETKTRPQTSLLINRFKHTTNNLNEEESSYYRMNSNLPSMASSKNTSYNKKYTTSPRQKEISNNDIDEILSRNDKKIKSLLSKNEHESI